MGKLLYLLGIQALRLIAHVMSLFNHKTKDFVTGRRGWKATLNDISTKLNGNTVWFHCASLGEFEQGRPVMERFKKDYPEWNLLVTFFSPSGYNIRKDYALADGVLYLPFDTPSNARDFIQIAQPNLVIFIKYEFWYFFLKEVYQQQIPLLLVSGIFRKKQLFFKWYGGFYQNILRLFTHIFVQDQSSYNLLKSIDMEDVTLGGDTRYDRVKEIYEGRKAISIAEKFRNGQTTLVAGSTWPEDIAVLAETLPSFKEALKLIIAPHEISPAQIQRIEQAFPNYRTVRYSAANLADIAQANLLIIDNIGMLSSLYQYADIAYVGGAFAQGLHNTLEAATYGIPVIFGAEYSKYREAIKLVEEGGAFSVKDSAGLKRILAQLLQDKNFREIAGKAAFQHVQQNTGATQRAIEWCQKHLQ